MLTTRLTRRFDLRVPIVSAPMGGVSDGRFAAAVSAAGALGTVSVTGGPPDAVAREAALAAAGGRPFGIGMLAWSMPHQLDLLDAALEATPALVSVSFGDFAPYVEKIKSSGAVCATQACTVEEAKEAADAGVDIVIARGGEGGGHGRNVVATLPLLQGVLDAVDIPVLAAGGIATPRGLAAVLAAGAAGAWVGSAFLACVEGANTPLARAAVVAAGESDTVYTTVLDMGRGVPWPSEFGGRAIRNAFADRWHGHADELAGTGERSDEPVVWAGEAIGLVTRERTVREVVDDFARAEDLLRVWGASDSGKD